MLSHNLGRVYARYQSLDRSHHEAGTSDADLFAYLASKKILLFRAKLTKARAELLHS